MAPDLTFKEIFARLEDWSRFPKYQLERRIDIFLTFFLVPFFQREAQLLRGASGVKAEVELVAPEFPLLSQIRDLLAARSGTRGPADLSRVDARTVNADYLLYRRSPHPAWLLVELKTDAGSFEKDQLQRYEAARDFGVAELCRHLTEKVLVKTDDKKKYRHLLDRLSAFPTALDEPVEIVYLAPELPEEPCGIVEAKDWSHGDKAARLHRLQAFNALGPFEPTNAWDPLSGLIDVISPRR
jgi:hypothetical protein